MNKLLRSCWCKFFLPNFNWCMWSNHKYLPQNLPLRWGRHWALSDIDTSKQLLLNVCMYSPVFQTAYTPFRSRLFCLLSDFENKNSSETLKGLLNQLRYLKRKNQNFSFIKKIKMWFFSICTPLFSKISLILYVKKSIFKIWDNLISTVYECREGGWF